MKIALLEDDISQNQLTTQWLEAAGHNVTAFTTGRSLIQGLTRTTYDLLILDWELPDLSGLDVLGWTKMRNCQDTPVIVLSQRSSGHDAATALEAGASDYIRKPVHREELLARILTAYSALTPRHLSTISLGQFRLDWNSGSAWRAGHKVELTSIQFDLAWQLFNAVGKTISREHLILAVWDDPQAIAPRTLDAHISNLRAKLGLRPENGLKITALYTYGYRIETCQQAEAS